MLEFIPFFPHPSLPGVKKALGKYGPTNVEDTTGSGAGDSKDDDDIDLFGSDDEEVLLKLLGVCCAWAK